jgi:hypothetical protein
MKKNTFSKISKHIFHLLPVVLLGVAAFLYPSWIMGIGILRSVHLLQFMVDL